MTRLSIVIVHYHTPALAAGAVAAVRRETALRDDVEVIVVDNGSTAEGAEVLRRLHAMVVTASENHGYAAGINLGLSHAAGLDVMVMNADVMVGPGCIDALQAALRDGAAVAGPALHWDRDGRVLLPPTERRDTTSRVMAHLSPHSAKWARQARGRWRRHAWRHWTASSTIDSVNLSGALLAFRRDVWNDVGPFDTSFRLYFEETEWLERAVTRGWSTRYVPSAHAHHLYNSSARHEQDAAEWFVASEREFDRRYPAPRAAARAARLIRTVPDSPEQLPAGPWAGAPRISIDAASVWIEVSSSSGGYPAAGQLVSGVSEWSMPEDVWEHLSPGDYSLRVVSPDGHELSAWAFRR